MGSLMTYRLMQVYHDEGGEKSIDQPEKRDGAREEKRRSFRQIIKMTFQEV